MISTFAVAAGSLVLLAVAVTSDVVTSAIAMVALLAIAARAEERRRARRH